MRISDWSSDVCSSDLRARRGDIDIAAGDDRIEAGREAGRVGSEIIRGFGMFDGCRPHAGQRDVAAREAIDTDRAGVAGGRQRQRAAGGDQAARCAADRSEEHTSELQSLMRISYAVFCWKKKKKIQQQ